MTSIVVNPISYLLMSIGFALVGGFITSTPVGLWAYENITGIQNFLFYASGFFMGIYILK